MRRATAQSRAITALALRKLPRITFSGLELVSVRYTRRAAALKTSRPDALCALAGVPVLSLGGWNFSAVLTAWVHEQRDITEAGELIEPYPA